MYLKHNQICTYMDNNNTELTVTTKLDGFSTVQEMMKWADTVLESGLLPDNISEPEQVITIVQHGRELGLTPHVALNNIHVIQGRPTVSASMLGALLKRYGVEWVIDADYDKVLGDDGKVIDRITTYRFFWLSKVTKKPIEAKHSVSWSQLRIAGYTDKPNYKKMPKEINVTL